MGLMVKWAARGAFGSVWEKKTEVSFSSLCPHWHQAQGHGRLRCLCHRAHMCHALQAAHLCSTPVHSPLFRLVILTYPCLPHARHWSKHQGHSGDKVSPCPHGVCPRGRALTGQQSEPSVVSG